jgi:phage major head subunit gpT-like protein
MNADLSAQALDKAIEDIKAMAEERGSVLLIQPTKLVVFGREQAQAAARILAVEGA